jgi:predicted DNA-binding ribbon-helix-helix protein
LPINDIIDDIRQRIVAAAAVARTKVGIVPLSRVQSLRIVSAISSRPSRQCSATCQGLEKTPVLAIVGGMAGDTSLVKHSVRIAGHATSVSLEAAFWAALGEIAARRKLSINALLAAIDAERSGNLSSAIRLFVLASCRRGELGGDPSPRAGRPL